MTNVIKTLWGISSFYVTLGLIGGLFYKSKKENYKIKKMELAIVSKANNGVKNSLLNTINHTLDNFYDYKINLVMDKDSDLEEELKEKYGNIVNIVTVPKNYSCEALAKGRAINYFIENNVKEDYFYTFIDDDNLILDNKFLYEIPYYLSKGYAAMNPIIKPRPGKSKACFVMDWVRYFDDKTIFRFATGLLKKPILGFHGELLGCKGSVLKEIGFNRKTITEDFSFADELMKKKYKTWQSSTELSVLSPNKIKDLLIQRNRWFKGILRDLKKTNWIIKIFTGVRMIGWMVGIFGNLFMLPILLILGMPFEIIAIGSISFFYYLFVYVYGAFQLKNIKDKLIYAILFPFYSVIENLSPYWGRWKKNKFEVIDKN